MLQRILYSFFLGLLLGVGSAGAADRYVKELPVSENLVKAIDVDLMDKDLGTVVRQMTTRSGIDVLVGPDVALPKEFPLRRLFFETRNLSVQQSADWIARALAIRYRLYDRGKTLEFTCSYDFLDKTPPVTRFLNLGGLTTRAEQKDFLAMLKELLKVYLMREPEYTLRLQGNKLVLMAHLPPVLQVRLKQILKALVAPGQIPVDPKAEVVPQGVQNALSLKVMTGWSDWGLHEVVRDLALQAGVNIGFDHYPLRGRDLPRLTLPKGEATLGEALNLICQKAGFAGIVTDPATGIWLSAVNPAERILGSRELFWNELPIQAYHVQAMAETLGKSGLLREARAAISNDVRADLSVGVAYHERSGNLIVVAPDSAQRQIQARLMALATPKE